MTTSNGTSFVSRALNNKYHKTAIDGKGRGAMRNRALRREVNQPGWSVQGSFGCLALRLCWPESGWGKDSGWLIARREDRIATPRELELESLPVLSTTE